MSLPIYNTALKELSMLQTQWSSQLNPLLIAPLASGHILTQIALVSGSNNIHHKLGRTLQGWFIVRQRAAASIYDTQDANLTPTVTLQLHASAPVKVDIFVF